MLRGVATHLIQKRQTRCLNLFSVFAQSVKKQVQENQEFKQNIKQLEDSNRKLQDSDAMQRAKKAMENSAQGTSKVVKAVGSAIGQTMDTTVVRKTVETVGQVSDAVSQGIHLVADPIMETKAAKSVASGVNFIKKDIVDTVTTHRYIEYQPKAARDAARAEKLDNNPLYRGRIISADPEAGAGVVVHQESRMTQRWNQFKETNKVFRGLLSVKKSVDESENPVLERFRELFGGAMEESEEAQVVRLFQQVDTTFYLDKFMRDATEFYIPDVMDAYVRGDLLTLKEWCSEQLYAQLSTGIKSQHAQGLISDCRILDIRKVELLQSKILDNELPILLVEFNTQEVLLFRNAKGDIALGSEDNIEHARYRMVFTKDQCVDPTIPINPKTYGWRAIEALKVDSWSGVELFKNAQYFNQSLDKLNDNLIIHAISRMQRMPVKANPKILNSDWQTFSKQKLCSAANLMASATHLPLDEHLKQTNCAYTNLTPIARPLVTRQEIEFLTLKFIELAQTQNDKIDRARFRDILADTFGIDDSLLMDRVFRCFDLDADNYIGLDEFIKGMSTFLKGKYEEKLKFYDLNGDRYISKEEMFQMLKNCLVKGAEEDEDGVKDLVDLVLKKLDEDRDGRVSEADWTSVISKETLLLEAFGQCLPNAKAIAMFLNIVEVKQNPRAVKVVPVSSARAPAAVTPSKVLVATSTKTAVIA